MSKNIKILISIAIPVIVLLLPTSWIPIQSLSLVEHRLIAIFAMATLFWIFEPIPIYATSLVIILLELVMVSDKGLYFFRMTNENLGQLLSYKSIMATFASPIILLFLGGFFLAMAATKYRLDLNLARVLLKPFGKNPKFVMLGLMIITAVFSMFMSNTATTAMMLALLTPILSVFQREDRGKIAIVLAIPVAANIGGMGTIVGTPPNGIAVSKLAEMQNIQIGFLEWSSYALPLVILFIPLAWLVLLYVFPIKDVSVKIKEDKEPFNKGDYLFFAIFVLTVVGWFTSNFHGLSAPLIGLISVVLLAIFRLFNRMDIR